MRTTVWNEEIGNHVAQILFDTKSYLVDFKRDRKDWYVWKSGIKAPCYCNCRYLNRSANASEACSAYMEACIRLKFPETQLVVGLASAGIPWSARVATRLALPMSFVRSEPKAHGIGKLVDGNPDRKMKAVVIDDLCGSGGTIIQAIHALEEEYEIETIGVVTITNWCFKNMWEKFDSINFSDVYSLTSYPNILRIGVAKNELTQDQADMLMEFYQAPKTYTWPL